MSFTRANPSGWTTRTQITTTQINALDINASRGIDGTAGGSYSPTSPIVIDGSGLDVTSTLSAAQLDVTTTVGVGTHLTVGGNTSLTGTLGVTGALTANSVSSLTMSGTGKVSLATRSVTRLLPLDGYFYDTQWYMSLFTYVCNISTPAPLFLPLRVPHQATLTSVAVCVIGAASLGALPGAPIRLSVTKRTLPVNILDDNESSFAGTETLVGSEVDDPVANLTDFQDAHWITWTGSSVCNRETEMYYATVTSHDTADLMKVGGLKITYSISAYDED